MLRSEHVAASALQQQHLIQSDDGTVNGGSISAGAAEEGFTAEEPKTTQSQLRHRRPATRLPPLSLPAHRWAR